MSRIYFTLVLITLINSSSANSFRITIPFTYDAGHIVVEATVNNSAIKGLFIFDTGGANLLEKKFAERLGIKNKSVVDKVTIGDLIIHKKRFKTHDWEKRIGGTWISKFSGMIGPDIMQDYIWQIDYRRSVITVTNNIKTLGLPENTKVVPFTPVKFHMPLGAPEVDILYGNKSRKYIVDTGDEAGLTDYIKPYRAEFKEKKIIPTDTFQAATRGYHSHDEAAKSFYVTQFQEVKLGNLRLNTAEVIISETPSIGMTIGNDFLQNYLTTFDWPAKKMFLTPMSNSNSYQCSDFVNKMKGND